VEHFTVYGALHNVMLCTCRSTPSFVNLSEISLHLRQSCDQHVMFKFFLVGLEEYLCIKCIPVMGDNGMLIQTNSGNYTVSFPLSGLLFSDFQ